MSYANFIQNIPKNNIIGIKKEEEKKTCNETGSEYPKYVLNSKNVCNCCHKLKQIHSEFIIHTDSTKWNIKI